LPDANPADRMIGSVSDVLPCMTVNNRRDLVVMAKK
jgi:hypothetical protein